MERVYSGVQYLGEKRKFKEHKESNSRIQEGTLARYGRHSKTRTQRRSIQQGRIARKVYGKEIIWMVR